jgi:hypothetical protein
MAETELFGSELYNTLDYSDGLVSWVVEDVNFVYFDMAILIIQESKDQLSLFLGCKLCFTPLALKVIELPASDLKVRPMKNTRRRLERNYASVSLYSARLEYIQVDDDDVVSMRMDRE